MREIGSEFWEVPVSEKENELFPECTQWFLSGRSALQAIIEDLKERNSCHTVAMPSWCCDSMIKPFVDVGMEIHFYPVYWCDSLNEEIYLKTDVLFLIDYFGYTSVAPNLKGYKGIIIRDVTHSIFSATYTDTDYNFGSLRKWCGVWTGGYAWSSDGHKLNIGEDDNSGYIALRKKAMELKRSYIDNKSIKNKVYLSVFDKAEEVLENIGVAPASKRDIHLAQRVDVKFIKSRRRSNASILNEAFPDWLLFREMKESDCPLFVPILIPNGKRDDLRQYLINNKIYCPIHWPMSKYHELDERTEYIYKNELSLVCDQRYTEDDMKRVIEVIKAFWKEM